jgi:hypothetical protein
VTELEVLLGEDLLGEVLLGADLVGDERLGEDLNELPPTRPPDRLAKDGATSPIIPKVTIAKAISDRFQTFIKFLVLNYSSFGLDSHAI